MELRLGQLLVRGGVLNEAQVQQILEVQGETAEPFGHIAERLFGVDPSAVENAWADQYSAMARRIDPEREWFDTAARDLITRRQAWQFRVLPVRFDPHELMLATTRVHLRRALRFAVNVLGVPVFVVMAEPEALGRGLCTHYPMPGMSPGSVLDDGMDRLIDAIRDVA